MKAATVIAPINPVNANLLILDKLYVLNRYRPIIFRNPKNTGAMRVYVS